MKPPRNLVYRSSVTSNEKGEAVIVSRDRIGSLVTVHNLITHTDSVKTIRFGVKGVEITIGRK